MQGYSFYVRNAIVHQGDILGSSFYVRNARGHAGEILGYSSHVKNASEHPGDILDYFFYERNAWVTQVTFWAICFLPEMLGGSIPFMSEMLWVTHVKVWVYPLWDLFPLLPIILIILGS